MGTTGDNVAMPQVDTVRLEDESAMEAGNVTSFPDAGRNDAARSSVLVFAADATLIDTVRKASPRDATVIQTSDLEHVSEQLASAQPDVLILDAAGFADVGAVATQITRQFPDLVLIVAGRREASAGLMKLTATGQIYRFLLVPLALGQTRLTLEAALRRRVERSMDTVRPVEAPAASGPPRGSLPRFAVPAAITVLLVAGIAGWLLSSKDSEDSAGTASVAAPQTAPSTPTVNGPAQAELALATQAMDRQQFVEPAGNSALEHFRAALNLEPGNAQARAGIRAVADKVVERAEAALLAERTDQAVAALELARNIQSDHPRLPFLDAQLQRERERLQLTQARDVSARLRPVLQQLNQRMEAGRLVSPAGQSARDALFEARRLDPTDPAVIQGFRDLTSRLLAEGDRALTAGQRDQAAAFAAAARDLSPTDARIAALERALTEQAPARSGATPAPAVAANNAASSPLALGRARLAEGRLLEPAGDNAKDYLLAARAANANDAEAQRLLAELKDRLIATGRQALAQQDFDGAAKSLAAANELGVRGSEDLLAGAQRDLDRQRADAEFRRNVISAGSLQRTRTVVAVYPEGPRRRGVTGWVDLQFTVTVTGTVEDITVTGAEPADVFNDAAITAVRGWRFAPVVRAGAPVPQRAATRLRFDISN